MKTIRFSTKAKNGIITIPKKYQKFLSNPVKVTLQVEAKEKEKHMKSTNTDIDMFFGKFQIDLRNYRFNRDDANER